MHYATKYKINDNNYKMCMPLCCKNNQIATYVNYNGKQIFQN